MSTHEADMTLKAWARARAYLVDGPAKGDRWRVRPCTGRGLFDIGTAKQRWTVNQATGLLWALCVELGRAVPVGPCPKCEGAKGKRCSGITAFIAQVVPGGWSGPQQADGSREGWAPCGDCAGLDELPTGLAIRPTAALVLELEIGSVPAFEHETLYPHSRIREALEVEADWLQASVPTCGMCRGDGWTLGVPSPEGWPGTPVEQVCPVCEGRRIDKRGEAQRVVGEALALWLAGGEEVNVALVDLLAWVVEQITVPCSRCQDRPAYDGFVAPRECPDCRGSRPAPPKCAACNGTGQWLEATMSASMSLSAWTVMPATCRWCSGRSLAVPGTWWPLRVLEAAR